LIELSNLLVSVCIISTFIKHNYFGSIAGCWSMHFLWQHKLSCCTRAPLAIHRNYIQLSCSKLSLSHLRFSRLPIFLWANLFDWTLKFCLWSFISFSLANLRLDWPSEIDHYERTLHHPYWSFRFRSWQIHIDRLETNIWFVLLYSLFLAEILFRNISFYQLPLNFVLWSSDYLKICHCVN